MRRGLFSVFLLVMLGALSFNAWAETVRCEASRDTWISSCGDQAEGDPTVQEVDTNAGKAKKIKLKGYQEFGLLDFDVAKLKGKKFGKAFIHVAFAEGVKNGGERGTDLRWFTFSTISSPWEEGQGGAEKDYVSDPTGHGATFNEASYKTRAWANFPGSKLWDVTLGNGNTLRSDADGGEPKDGYFTIPIDVRLVEARVNGASEGFMIMDGSVFISTNAYIHSRESDKPPFLTVEVEGDAKPEAAPVANLKVTPAPNDATVTEGALTVSLTVPAGAFSYDVTLNGKPVPRWQIPFAAKAGAEQHFLIEYLPPDTDAKLDVVAVDTAGNKSAPISATTKTSPALSVPKLPESTWNPKGGAAPLLGKVKVWAFPQIAKLDPLSGKVIVEKGLEDAQSKNSVWDAGSKTVRLLAAKGEIVGFQLGFEGQSVGLKTTVEGLDGIQVRQWREWFVKIGDTWHSDYALPLKAGDGISIPDQENNIENQKASALALDLFVPEGAKPGVHEGKLKLTGDAGTLELKLVVEVFDVIIPKETNFIPELNCYSGPLSDAGQEPFFDAFRIAHYNRCAINRVPHGHQGRTAADWSAKVGPDGHVTDWAEFDKNLGPLLDGSAFTNNPRAGVPTPLLYLPFNESYPLSFKENYKPGEKVPLVGENWKPLHDMTAKSPEDSFSQEYKDAFVNCVKDYVAHFEEKGWNKTIMEGFHNNKVQYGQIKGPDGKPVPALTGTAWTLDEPQTWLDWQALLFYSKLFHKGIEGQKTTKFGFRGDISRPMWQGSCMDGNMEVMVANNGQFEFPPLMKASKLRMPTKLWTYGSTDATNGNHEDNIAWCLKAYVHECDGILPWQCIGDAKSFDEGDGKGENGNMLVVDGRRFGVNAVASFRVHALREGAQLVELLRLLQLKKGWGRAHCGALIEQAIPLGTQFKQARADDAAGLKFGDLNAEKFVKLKESLLRLLAQ